jgi:hypothetical protein
MLLTFAAKSARLSWTRNSLSHTFQVRGSAPMINVSMGCQWFRKCRVERLHGGRAHSDEVQVLYIACDLPVNYCIFLQAWVYCTIIRVGLGRLRSRLAGPCHWQCTRRLSEHVRVETREKCGKGADPSSFITFHDLEIVFDCHGAGTVRAVVRFEDREGVDLR